MKTGSTIFQRKRILQKNQVTHHICPQVTLDIQQTTLRKTNIFDSRNNVSTQSKQNKTFSKKKKTISSKRFCCTNEKKNPISTHKSS